MIEIPNILYLNNFVYVLGVGGVAGSRVHAEAPRQRSRSQGNKRININLRHAKCQ